MASCYFLRCFTSKLLKHSNKKNSRFYHDFSMKFQVFPWRLYKISGFPKLFSKFLKFQGFPFFLPKLSNSRLFQVYKFYGHPGWWNLHFWSALSYHARQRPKYHRFTHFFTLAPCFTKISGDFQVLTLLPKPWHMVVSGGNKRLMVFRNVLWVLGQHSIVLLIELCLQSDFLSEKQFQSFTKFQRRPALSAPFCCWRTVGCWCFFGFKGESLRSEFTIVLVDFGSILKSQAIFSWSVLYPSLPFLEHF